MPEVTCIFPNWVCRCPHDSSVFHVPWIQAIKINWEIWTQGDIILSVILSIADTPPFGPGDKARGIAYTSVFVAVASMLPENWNLESIVFLNDYCRRVRTGYKLIESDFTNSRAAKEEPEASIGLQRSIPIDDETAEIASPSSPGCLYQGSMAVPVTRSEVADDGVCVSPVPILPIPRLATQTIPDAPITLPITPPSVTLSLPPPAARKVSVLATLLSRLRWFVEPLLCPPSVGVLLGLVIGLVPPAKALFVAEGGKEMLGLDGRPVLGFVYDTACFVGECFEFGWCMVVGLELVDYTDERLLVPIFREKVKHMYRSGTRFIHHRLHSVQPPMLNQSDSYCNNYLPEPLTFSLLLLGAAVFSFRLRPVPNPISVPFPSYLPLLLAFTKLLVIPFATILLLHLIVVRPGGPLDPARKMLRFVLAFQSCTPTGTSVVFLVQCYNPSGEAGEIARWLLVQYVVGVVTMTVVIGWMVWTLGE
ncbi:hypothetical protein BC936DRAFT_145252 [Jimgerdemannia flammicorona]|uniref:Auxin efflux carrier n=1 Tax=Jimgerdemannia flammicorona TaxID=994334 RepID=A0A433DAH4_9FUNG|nr:hypothetical protein BC936DRAFT_145252 [Jimgerdemannia flammicorona]